jgi:hypothetical protein
MEERLLKKLKAGLEDEIRHYESMLKISREEQEVLKKEAYSSELISLASEKLRLMNLINQTGLMLSPLKLLWIKEREENRGSPPESEIDTLINNLSEVLEDLLAVDRANTRKLAELTSSASTDEPPKGTDPRAATQAYKSMSDR